MVNWEKELKNYIAKKVKETLGFEMDAQNIGILTVNTDIDLTLLDIDELAMVYAFAIMREDFEHAKVISDELETRNCDIKININPDNKTGAINVYLRPEASVAYLDIKLKVLPDGMIVDFENQKF